MNTGYLKGKIMRVQNCSGINPMFKALYTTNDAKSTISQDEDLTCKVAELTEELNDTKEWDLIIDKDINGCAKPVFVRRNEDALYKFLDADFINKNDVGTYVQVSDTSNPDIDDRVALIRYNSANDAIVGYTKIKNLNKNIKTQNDGYFYFGKTISAAADVLKSLEKADEFLLSAQTVSSLQK